ncbi:DUF3748 domain-containing protein [Maribellus maritimus]|uniref:DUF3748 domain-containing protein n=1 Tax=Maribellus maritimus TaxID=2870838 RepID=UPI001EEB730E|nr:DUF3748 domain-containing protein [Maribellus maritimus]MCG6188056.1 DUF3748 domain-containing protein [Maribellus maritimus]
MKRKRQYNSINAYLWLALLALAGCFTENQNEASQIVMKEKQISFSDKNHVLDNNDNFSPDGNFLCYDTRGTIFNEDIGNCKTIEKIEIATGRETILYEPESITGEQAAPGVGAVSWHPSEEKVIFIQGPLLEEVKERGYYGKQNRTGVEVSTDGKGAITKVDMRDVSTEGPTIPGAQRGGTHRHEYSRNGKRIGFTYDDFLVTNIDRTIGYMEKNQDSPEGYSHYFSVIVKPAGKGRSKAGQIEKAYGDSWVDSAGTMRAFIGKVRAGNGLDYDTSLFVADIPDNVDITTAFSGDSDTYPKPPEGIKIRRLTYSGSVSDIVRGSADGKKIAYLAGDKEGVKQIFLIDADGSELSSDKRKQPLQLSHFSNHASCVRWHPSGNWVLSIVNGNIAASCTKPGNNFGKSVMLTNDKQDRNQLVVSGNGEMLAYNIFQPNKNTGKERGFMQIFVMELAMDELNDIFNIQK